MSDQLYGLVKRDCNGRVEAGESQRKAPIWPRALITVALLLFAVTAIILNLSPSNPRIQLVYADSVPSTDFVGETMAEFWVTNSSSRAVKLAVLCIETTNALGQWYSYALPRPRGEMTFALGPSKFHITAPSGVTTWRARFRVETRLKGWEIYWWYTKLCGKQLLSGSTQMPYFPRSMARGRIFDISGEMISPVVLSK